MADDALTEDTIAEEAQPNVAEFEGSAIPADELERLTDDIVTALKSIYDPEIPADIYEIGLIYKVDIDDSRHVKIDMLYEKFSPRRRALLDSITFLFFALYIGMMLWATTKYAWRSVAILEMSDSPWRPPLWPMKVFLAVGVFLILLQGIAKFIRDLHFALTGKDL